MQGRKPGSRHQRTSRLVVFTVAALLLGTWLPGAGVAPAQAEDLENCQDRLLGDDSVAPSARECLSPPAVSESSPAVSAMAAALPAGFTESIVFSGLVNPTNIEFAADGRVFVAEKSGFIRVYDNLSDPTPTTFTVLETNVNNYWDRGMLGLALDPSLTNPALPLRPWVYVLYAYDHILGSPANPPRWGDACLGSPNGPGPTTDGCVVSGRLSRFTVTGSTISGPEQVLIEDWCQQFPSHSVGALGFGPDGALYVSSGDGASFNGVDYGQLGGTIGSPPYTPKNPCADPPGGAMTPLTAEGGALRSQDLRTDGAPAGNAYAATVLADGPVAYWRLGETSGTSAADSSGTNTGTYTGGFTLGQAGALAGDPNTAVRLNGTSGAVNVPDANALDRGNGPLSYELWVKRADAGTYYQLLYTKYSQGNLYFLNNKFTFDDGNVSIAAESGTTTDTNWHHFVVTRSGSGPGNTKIYKDGVNVTTELDTSRTLSSNASAARLGAYEPIYGLYLNGSLDEVAVYPTALSGGQVQAHYAAATTP